jgi:hypothetical protein
MKKINDSEKNQWINTLSTELSHTCIIMSENEELKEKAKYIGKFYDFSFRDDHLFGYTSLEKYVFVESPKTKKNKKSNSENIPTWKLDTAAYGGGRDLLVVYARASHESKVYHHLEEGPSYGRNINFVGTMNNIILSNQLIENVFGPLEQSLLFLYKNRQKYDQILTLNCP